jgi:hypothetical protein
MKENRSCTSSFLAWIFAGDGVHPSQNFVLSLRKFCSTQEKDLGIEKKDVVALCIKVRCSFVICQLQFGSPFPGTWFQWSIQLHAIEWLESIGSNGRFLHIVIIIFRFQGTVFTFVARLEGIYFLKKKKGQARRYSIDYFSNYYIKT